MTYLFDVISAQIHLLFNSVKSDKVVTFLKEQFIEPLDNKWIVNGFDVQM